MYPEICIPTTYQEIISLLLKFTNFSQDEVEENVWMEALEPGWNVLRDVSRFGVTPHVYNEAMEHLYQEGTSFIFETLVFWAKSERQQWTMHARNRIEHYRIANGRVPKDLSILVFGDGTGNDSLYFASSGYVVDYFDIPGSQTFDFAYKRFDFHGLLTSQIRIVDNYESCLNGQYDIVICFEVLEHLPNPLSTIKDLYKIIKPNGIVFVTEAFGGILNYLPTHLLSNKQYENLTPFLFLDQGLVLSWYSKEPNFKPMEFTKIIDPSSHHYFQLLANPDVGKPYISTKMRPLRHMASKSLSCPIGICAQLLKSLSR